jgi:hypothetical protein
MTFHLLRKVPPARSGEAAERAGEAQLCSGLPTASGRLSRGEKRCCSQRTTQAYTAVRRGGIWRNKLFLKTCHTRQKKRGGRVRWRETKLQRRVAKPRRKAVLAICGAALLAAACRAAKRDAGGIWRLRRIRQYAEGDKARSARCSPRQAAARTLCPCGPYGLCNKDA